MRLYRWLLRHSAPSLDREYGRAMEETFARRVNDARRRSGARVVYVWVRELAGLAVLHVHERQWKAGRMEGMVLEIRHAARRLLRSPAFTCAAVMTLALAIGANAAIFAVVERVVMRPLPYPDSDRLIELDHGALALNLPSDLGLTSGLYFYYADRARTITQLAIYRSGERTLTGDGAPERIRVTEATPSLAAVLRVAPQLGRWFSDREASEGSARVAVVSNGFWTRRYGRRADIIGRTLTIEGEPLEIIGVMPASFAFPDPAVDVWTAERVTRANGFSTWNFEGVARLGAGISVEDARTELNALIADVARAYPNDPRALGNVEARMVFTGRALKTALVGGVARALWVLLAAVGLVLLVACANVANLFLVRSDVRQREIALRRALGAGRWRLARYFFAESALLGAGGAVIGLALAWAAVALVVGFAPPNLPRLHEIELDRTSVAFTALLGVLTALAFGALPLWRPLPMAASLQESGRGNTVSRRRYAVRQMLMAGQVALALVLIVASGLMARSFQKLRALDPGFNPDSTLTFAVGLPDRKYTTLDAVLTAHHTLVDRLAALPGVTAVSATSCLPFSGGCYGNTVRVEGRTYPDGTIPPVALFRAVAGGYIEAMGMRILAGRGITRADVDRRERIVVINDALAKRFFPNEDPLGKRLASNRAPKQPLDWLTVVGVVSDTATTRVLPERSAMPQLFMPMSIAAGPGVPATALIGPGIGMMQYVVRTSTPPLDLVPAARRVIDAIDPNLPIAQARTLQDLLDRASAQMAFTMTLLAIAAVVALTLGVVGIYGVTSYIVSQRTTEIGVRLALGANPGDVAAAIVRQGGRVALAGIAAGLGAALAGGRAIEALLFGVSPRDPLVFAATTVALFGVALVACWLPARRAARLSPVDALRC